MGIGGQAIRPSAWDQSIGGGRVQAQLTLTQAQDAVRKNEQDLKTAQLALARWTTVPVEAVAEQAPSLVAHVSNLPIEELEKYHPTVLAARRAIALADAETTVATRERSPDWSFEAGFSQRPEFSNMVSVRVSIPLPVNRAERQDRDVAERAAMGTEARLQYEDAVREAQTEIYTLSSTLESLKGRVSRLNDGLLPAARQQAELATAAYRAGTGSLSSVFSARKTLLEQQLQLTEQLSWHWQVPVSHSVAIGLAPEGMETKRPHLPGQSSSPSLQNLLSLFAPSC